MNENLKKYLTRVAKQRPARKNHEDGALFSYTAGGSGTRALDDLAAFAKDVAGWYGFVVDVLPEHFGGAAAGLVDGQLYGGQARIQLGTEIVAVAADHLDVPSGAEVADLERLIDQLRQPVVESEDSVGDAVLIE